MRLWRRSHFIEDSCVAKIFREARRKRAGDIALLRGKKVCETRGIETPVTLLLAQNAEHDRPKKAH
jgi:hypothetical protein